MSTTGVLEVSLASIVVLAVEGSILSVVVADVVKAAPVLCGGVASLLVLSDISDVVASVCVVDKIVLLVSLSVDVTVVSETPTEDVLSEGISVDDRAGALVVFSVDTIVVSELDSMEVCSVEIAVEGSSLEMEVVDVPDVEEVS